MSTFAAIWPPGWRVNHCLTQFTTPVCAFLIVAFASDGLSHEVWSYAVSSTLRIGESCGSPSLFIASTACVKLPKPCTAMPCMNFCQCCAYSVLYIATSVFWICSGLPSSVRSSADAVFSTQSFACSSFVAASRIAGCTYWNHASRVNVPGIA